MTEAARTLLASNIKVADLAFDFQFGDHETFTRGFKRQFGCSPSELRQAKTLPEACLLERVADGQKQMADRSWGREPELVQRPDLKLVGLVAPVSTGRMVGEKWRQFSLEVSEIARRMRPERFYQFVFWPEKYEMDGFYVMPSVEVDDLSDIPVALVGKTVPRGGYLKFIHKGTVKTLPRTYRRIYEEYLPGTCHRLNHPYNFEVYGVGFTAPDDPDSETEIYIPIE